MKTKKKILAISGSTRANSTNLSYIKAIAALANDFFEIEYSTNAVSFIPVALITASTNKKKAHQSLLGTLKIIEANITEETQLLISFAKTKINNESIIIDQETLESVKKLIHALALIVDNYENPKA